MGCYLAKSTIVMGRHQRDGETFTVCDLFDSDQEELTAQNEREMRGSYATLTRRAFEANYLSFHDELPRILQAPTSVVPDEVTDDSCRFVHVDASHMYEHVHPDIAAARDTLKKDGIVVLDDFRSEHTPGVACATWAGSSCSTSSTWKTRKTARRCIRRWSRSCVAIALRRRRCRSRTLDW